MESYHYGNGFNGSEYTVDSFNAPSPFTYNDPQQPPAKRSASDVYNFDLDALLSDPLFDLPPLGTSAATSSATLFPPSTHDAADLTTPILASPSISTPSTVQDIFTPRDFSDRDMHGALSPFDNHPSPTFDAPPETKANHGLGVDFSFPSDRSTYHEQPLHPKFGLAVHSFDHARPSFGQVLSSPEPLSPPPFSPSRRRRDGKVTRDAGPLDVVARDMGPLDSPVRSPQQIQSPVQRYQTGIENQQVPTIVLSDTLTPHRPAPRSNLSPSVPKKSPFGISSNTHLTSTPPRTSSLASPTRSGFNTPTRTSPKKKPVLSPTHTHNHPQALLPGPQSWTQQEAEALPFGSPPPKPHFQPQQQHVFQTFSDEHTMASPFQVAPTTAPMSDDDFVAYLSSPALSTYSSPAASPSMWSPHSHNEQTMSFASAIESMAAAPEEIPTIPISMPDKVPELSASDKRMCDELVAMLSSPPQQVQQMQHQYPFLAEEPSTPKQRRGRPKKMVITTPETTTPRLRKKRSRMDFEEDDSSHDEDGNDTLYDPTAAKKQRTVSAPQSPNGRRIRATPRTRSTSQTGARRQRSISVGIPDIPTSPALPASLQQAQQRSLYSDFEVFPSDDEDEMPPDYIDDYFSVRPDQTSKTGKRYVCLVEECDKVFDRKYAIVSHVQGHLEDKPFMCPEVGCNASFVRHHDLRRHERIHSGNKPHKCECGKGFSRCDALMRHRHRNICVGGRPGPVNDNDTLMIRNDAAMMQD